ncbi:MAG: HAD hydrolase-like protein [Alphaproteobacteria bacterium]|nr:HAD hydrolase-like protein [Alphaproteobacteria bacterium]
MQKLEALIFELDGPLVDPTIDIKHALNLMLEEVGRPPVTHEQIRSFYGEGLMDLCSHALEATGGIDDDDLYSYVQKFISHFRQLKPDPIQIQAGALDLLQKMGADGIKLGICTNKTEVTVQSLMRDLDLRKYFGFVAGGDTFPVHKPNPAHITGVLDALQAPVSGAVFIGSTATDLVACFRANIPCVIVTHGVQQEMEEMGETIMIEELTELNDALGKLGFQI